MASLTAITRDFGHIFAAARASTIMGAAFADVPDLPLSRPDIDLPAPAVVIPTPAILRPSERIVDETRVLALHLHRSREHLTDWDRVFVRELLKWRCPPSAHEADQVAALAEKLFWQARDQAPHSRRWGRA